MPIERSLKITVDVESKLVPVICTTGFPPEDGYVCPAIQVLGEMPVTVVNSFTLWGHNFNLWCKPQKPVRCTIRRLFPYSAFKELLAHIAHKLTFDVPKR